MRALDGLLVVTVEHALAAPLCSARLAAAGARVIKVERAEGDFARNYDHVAHGESAYFVWVNQGKESIVLDLKDTTDIELLHNIVAKADVFLQNLGPGAAARLGLDSEDLTGKNPRLIVCNISGYGNNGEYSDMKAYDMLVQCETGLASVTGGPNEAGRVGISICDISAGLTAYQLILEALLIRGTTGQGQTIDVSMFDALAEWMNVPYLHQVYGGKAPERVGVAHPSIAPYGVFTTSDGASVVIGIQNEREWTRLCTDVGGRPEVATDERFVGNASRVKNRVALDNTVGEMIGTLSKEEVVSRLRAAGIAFAQLRSMEEFSRHPQLKLHTANTATGPVDLIAPVGHRNDAPTDVPALGQHGNAIRTEFGGSTLN
jgi:crotonobetainyl-CoA:carnitine CoA-transferase CaiB-like acyl-CoA transferase